MEEVTVECVFVQMCAFPDGGADADVFPLLSVSPAQLLFSPASLIFLPNLA